jgi:hypothetical protein
VATTAVDDDKKEIQIVVVFGVVVWWWSLQGVVVVAAHAQQTARPNLFIRLNLDRDAGIRLHFCSVLVLFCHFPVDKF